MECVAGVGRDGLEIHRFCRIDVFPGYPQEARVPAQWLRIRRLSSDRLLEVILRSATPFLQIYQPLNWPSISLPIILIMIEINLDVYLNHIILFCSLMDKLSLLKTDSPWVASTQNLLTANWFLLLIMIYITQLNMNHRPNSGDETQIFLMSRLAKEIRRRPWIEKYLSQPHSHSFRYDRDHQKSKTSTRFQWSNAATLITHAAVSSHLNSDMHRLLLYRRRKWSVIRHNSNLTRNQAIITTVENYRRRRTTAKLKCNENRVRI